MNIHEKIESLTNSKRDSIQNKLDALKAKQAKLTSLARRTAFVANVFEHDEDIQKAIKKLGLDFGDLKLVTVGQKAMDSESVDNDAFLNGTLVPTSEKFKFISFKGYDARGAGKNHKQLEAKRAKLEEKLSSENFRASINVYSLEDNATTWGSSRERANRVLIDWRPKFD